MPPQLMNPAAARVAKIQKKHVRASDSGPSRNSARTKFNVYIDNRPRMSSVSAKKLAPYVAQLTGLNASVIIDRLKSGFQHVFPNKVVVSVIGSSRGEGVLDWLTKAVGSTGLFKSKEQAPAGTPVNNQIKASFPADTKTLYQMNSNVYANRHQDVGDWKYISGTKFLSYYMKANNIIVAVRGTADLRDLMADIKITFQNVQGSRRYKEDVLSLRAFQQQYPTSQYNYYFTGHSLGGALIDEYLKLGMGISAISFNPAVQKEFYNAANHHRIYNTQDPLYDLMGKHVPSAEVRDYKGPQQSMFDRVLSYVPIIGDASKALKGHSLDNYIGGRMRNIVPAVIDRPHLRGPSMIGGGFGDWFMSNVVNPVANVAIPAMTLGSLTANDVRKGQFVPDPNKIAPYLVQSGSNLLAAKSGDPTGAIGQVVRTAKTGEYAEPEEGSGRCRWVDKGSRYPDWQEVCDGGGYFYDNPKHGRVYCANC